MGVYELSIYDIIISATITIVAYMTFPIYAFCIKKDVYTLKQRRKIVFWNSVLIATLFIIVRAVMYGVEFGLQSFAPAFLYYCINKLLFARKKEDEEETDIKEQKKEKSLKIKKSNQNPKKRIIILKILL